MNNIPKYSFFFLIVGARFQPVHSQSCGTQPVVNQPVSHDSAFSRIGFVIVRFSLQSHPGEII